jgi:hypothetical protein
MRSPPQEDLVFQGSERERLMSMLLEALRKVSA